TRSPPPPAEVPRSASVVVVCWRYPTTRRSASTHDTGTIPSVSTASTVMPIDSLLTTATTVAPRSPDTFVVRDVIELSLRPPGTTTWSARPTSVATHVGPSAAMHSTAPRGSTSAGSTTHPHPRT